MKYKGILIDLDGTLVESKQDIAKTVNVVLTQLGLPTLPLEEVYSYIGNGVSILMRKSLISSLKEEPSRLLEPGVSLFKTHYNKHLLDETQCYLGVIDTLKVLEPYRKGIVTNKNRDFTMAILKGLDILSYFPVVVAGDDVSNRKPHPEHMLSAVKEMDLLPEEVIVVGDNYTDIEGGKNAGLTTCFVTYGMGKLKEVQPDITIDSFDQLLDIVS